MHKLRVYVRKKTLTLGSAFAMKPDEIKSMKEISLL
jgi:hypothetical protein